MWSYRNVVPVKERATREQAELRRRKMELEQAERSKAERERQRAREEDEAVESALKAQQHDSSTQQQMTDAQLLAQKERERLREQQRRRLAAVSYHGPLGVATFYTLIELPIHIWQQLAFILSRRMLKKLKWPFWCYKWQIEWPLLHHV